MSRFRIQTLNNISHLGLKRLPDKRYNVASDASAPDAILVRSQKMHDLPIPDSVRAIGRAGAGTDNIPVAKLSARGIPVFNAPGANANAVNELVLTALLLASRNLVPALKFVRDLPESDDKSLHALMEEKKKLFAGSELPNHTLGILGLGAIGSLVAETAIKLGMKVVGYDPEITVEGAWRLPSQVKKAESVEEVIKAGDFISLHIPLLEKTRHLINAERIALMRNHAVLLNFARDGLVDDHAVLAGLQAKKLKYYLSDFPSAALRDHPQAIAFPHLGASTAEAEENCAVMVVDQLRDFLEHGNVTNSVNFPTAQLTRESPFRLGIAHANVPNMLAQISRSLGESDVNIHNMLNKSKVEVAYTLVDVDSSISAAVISSIAAIKGVLSVRFIPLEIV